VMAMLIFPETWSMVPRHFVNIVPSDLPSK
jgi:hypothetical protein